MILSPMPVLRGVLWIDRLLGLDQVSWSSREVLLGWRYELPLWVWALIALGAIALAAWSYSRIFGNRWGRWALAGVRATLVMVAAAALAGPMLVLPREDVEPDVLLMLVDRSASMQVRDAFDSQDQQHTLVTRDAAMRRSIGRQIEVFNPGRLGHNRRLLWLGFDAQAYPIAPPSVDSDVPAWSPAQGRATVLRTAIEQALQRASGRPISGVVLFTDGRSAQSTGPGFVHRLGQQAVSVFPVPIGADAEQVDLSVGRVDAPDRAFVHDVVPVSVWIDRYPVGVDIDPQWVRVRLVDPQTGQTLDEKTPGPSGMDGPVRLTGSSPVAGPMTWRVEVVYEPPGVVDPPAPPPAGDQSDHGQPTSHQPATDHATVRELITDNNQRLVDLELIDRPIRVLYVEGYPRWEYRYLKSILIREKGIDVSVLLVSADRDYAQEGDLPITRLPGDAKEMDPFDVVIIGDVPAQSLSSRQGLLLRDQVAARGAGLVWIGGAYHTPYSYDATPLADLLPMMRPGLTEPVDTTQDTLDVQPTPLARALNVLMLREPEPGSADGDHPEPLWPSNLPGLRWAQAIGPLKPSVEVLATAQVGLQGSAVPLVTRMRYGAGQVVYVATDDTWRWRYGLGDLYFQQFWVQLVQMLGRQRVHGDTGRVRLSISHRRIEVGQSVVVELQIDDSGLSDDHPQQVRVGVTRQGKGSSEGSGRLPGELIERIELAPQPTDHLASAISTSRQGESSANRVFKAVWRPTTSGRLELRLIEPAIGDLDVALPVEVIQPDDELRHPLADHDRLASLAQQTGGQVVSLSHLDQLTDLVPNRARRTPNDLRESIWDSPLMLILVMGLLTVEWVGRKLIRLA
jgi:hypothetical protein